MLKLYQWKEMKGSVFMIKTNVPSKTISSSKEIKNGGSEDNKLLKKKNFYNYAQRSCRAKKTVLAAQGQRV